MGDHVPPNPNPNPAPPPTSLPPPPTVTAAAAGRFRLPPIRVTSEFDSERGLFSHRLSCRLLNGLAKLRLRLNHGAAAAVGSSPELALLTRHFVVVVDAASRSALLRGAFNLADSLSFRAAHNTKSGQIGEQPYVQIGCSTHCSSISCTYEYDKSIVSCIHLAKFFQFKYHNRKEKQEVAMTANLGDSSCKIELSSLVPPNGLPRATLFFPNGEISVKEKKTGEDEKILAVNGIVQSHVLNGVCTALYKENEMNIRYCYKDDELSFIPSMSLPSNALSFAFKRRFSPSDKLSYWYHFDTSYWSAVYTHNTRKHVKWKAGYESDSRLGWASLWVGDEDCKTKTAPMKMKVQFRLQVPQDNVRNSVILFRVKKRWDL